MNTAYDKARAEFLSSEIGELCIKICDGSDQVAISAFAAGWDAHADVTKAVLDDHISSIGPLISPQGE